MVSKSRWASAQEYEQSYWDAQSERIASGSDSGLGWYEWRANRLKDLLAETFSERAGALASGRVLEVGSGPVGIVSFLEAAEATAIDPLCDFYSTQAALTQHRSSRVRYLNGGGEELPFESGHFDLLIIDNVIDHVLNAGRVMEEVHRVLRPGGVLYFTVNLHPMWGFFLHRIVSKLGIDRGHPHTFTLGKVRRFLDEHGFEGCFEEWGSFAEAWREDLRSSSLKARLKGVSGLSEYLYTALAERRPA